MTINKKTMKIGVVILLADKVTLKSKSSKLDKEG